MPRRKINPETQSVTPDVVIGSNTKPLTHYQKYKDTIKRCQKRIKDKMDKLKEEEKDILQQIENSKLRVECLKQIKEMLEKAMLKKSLDADTPQATASPDEPGPSS